MVSTPTMPIMACLPNMASATVLPASVTKVATSIDLLMSPCSRACSSRLAVGCSVCWESSFSSAMAYRKIAICVA